MRTLIVLVLLSATASAHVTLTSPPPRTLENKAGPCGAAGSKRGSKVTTFAPGAMITVEWDETIDHPGHYRIAFDNDGDDAFINPSGPGDDFAFTLAEPIADKNGGHYTYQVQLPTTTCSNCTLQLIQVMTTQVPYNSFYFQCADIAIADGGAPDGGVPDAGVPRGRPGSAPPVQGGCSTGAGGGAAGALIGLASLVARRRASYAKDRSVPARPGTARP